MRKKYNIFLCFLCMVLLILSGCGKSEEPDGNDYQDGMIESGKQIEDYFELTGDISVMNVGATESVAVHASKTADGGAVAWKDSYYSYSPDGSIYTVAAHLAMDVFDADAYTTDGFKR